MVPTTLKMKLLLTMNTTVVPTATVMQDPTMSSGTQIRALSVMKAKRCKILGRNTLGCVAPLKPRDSLTTKTRMRENEVHTFIS